MTEQDWKTRRENYLRSTGRTHALVAEGFVHFGIHQGGRYTPMAELTRLCQEPERETPDLELPDESKPDLLREQVCRLRSRGFKGREIAEQLRMPAASVRTILHRAGMSKRWSA